MPMIRNSMARRSDACTASPPRRASAPKRSEAVPQRRPGSTRRAPAFAARRVEARSSHWIACANERQSPRPGRCNGASAWQVTRTSAEIGGGHPSPETGSGGAPGFRRRTRSVRLRRDERLESPAVVTRVDGSHMQFVFTPRSRGKAKSTPPVHHAGAGAPTRGWRTPHPRGREPPERCAPAPVLVAREWISRTAQPVRTCRLGNSCRPMRVCAAGAISPRWNGPNRESK
jgi:hypothetical protein